MNEQIKDGGPAFGQVVELRCVRVDPTGEQEWEPEVCYHGGLSVRDYFAAKALQGWIGSSPTISDEKLSNTKNHAKKMATTSYLFADAMLAAREAKS